MSTHLVVDNSTNEADSAAQDRAAQQAVAELLARTRWATRMWADALHGRIESSNAAV